MRIKFDENALNKCKVCGQCAVGALCQCCLGALTAAKDSFMKLNTCQTCGHSVSGIGPRGSTDLACVLDDDWIVPSNGFCNQHFNRRTNEQS